MKIFKNEKALRPEYMPEQLPFRENHLKRLQLYFSQFIEEPGSICPKVVLIGKAGTGKTVTARKFGEYVNQVGEARRLKYVHVYCYSKRTLFAVLKDIAQQLNIAIPRRGLSVSDLMQVLLESMNDRDLYAIVTLDDVFHLTDVVEEEQLSDFIKFSEEMYYKTGKYRIGMILVSQDPRFMERLDKSARSLLGNVKIEFEPYTKEQIYVILEQRAKIALREGTYSEDILEMIADVAGTDEEKGAEGHRGDARFALDVLWQAAKLAELEGADKINPEHVREALKHSVPGIPVEYLEGLALHKKLFLLAIVKALKSRRNQAYVPFGYVEETYNMICEQYGERPRKHTQLWEYLKELKKLGIVETRLSGKGMRGRTTLISLSREISISIPAEPLEGLERLLEELIKREIS